MPIYEYRCTACKAELEKLQKISDPPLVECPECGRDTLIKLISASSFRLKGSGWYETDFKTGNKKNVAAEENSGKTDKDNGSASADGAGKVAAKETESRPASDTSDKGSDKSSEKSKSKIDNQSGGQSAKDSARQKEPGSNPPNSSGKTSNDAKPAAGNAASPTKPA
jgi:putative FmdB family regulatory protein